MPAQRLAVLNYSSWRAFSLLSTDPLALGDVYTLFLQEMQGDIEFLRVEEMKNGLHNLYVQFSDIYLNAHFYPARAIVPLSNKIEAYLKGLGFEIERSDPSSLKHEEWLQGSSNYYWWEFQAKS